jgi:NADPH2:quinone reductase
MKVIQFEQHGEPEVLQLVERPQPVPGAGEVLIKVKAIGLNYAETMHRRGMYPQPVPLPMIPGTDVAGVIEQLGEGVTLPAVGTRVVTSLYPGAPGGGYAEYVAVNASRVVPVPEAASLEASLALLGQGWTAYLLLTQAGKLQAGESVLVHAAAGGVGTLAVQLAKVLGAGQVIGLVSSEAKQVLAQTLGCDQTFLNFDPHWAQQVKAATHDRGVDIVLDSVGAAAVADNLYALAPFGRLVTYGALSQQMATLSAAQTVQLLFGNQAFIGFSVPGFVEAVGYAEALTTKLLGYLAEDKLNVIVEDVFPFEAAAEAHRAIEARRTVGKVVLQVQ